MCCGSASQKPSEILSEIKRRTSSVKIFPKPFIQNTNPQYFSIPKEVKEQLLMQQQLARLPKKTG